MKKLIASLALLVCALPLHAQTAYPLFEPADGILVGDQDTYVTTAADSADVISLWSGSCSISTFLRGDGSCGAASITGAALTKTDDTNVTLTLGGSPSTALVNASSLTLGWTGQLSTARGGTGVSSLGNLTKTDDTNVTLTLGGTPTGALINNTSLTLGWTGTLGVSRGGIGVGTLTGIAKGNGTSAFTAAASSDVISLWTGTCNSGTFLRADGTCQAVGGGSGSVTSITFNGGLTASPNPITTTGTASLDLTSANTWTGVQRFASGAAPIRMNAADSLGDNYIQAYSNDGTTARWYLGNGGSSDNNVTFNNDATGDTNISTTSGTVRLNANGSTGEVEVTTSGVAVAVPATVTGTGGNDVIVNDNTAGKATIALQSSGTKMLVGLSGAVEGDSSTHGAIFAETGGQLRFYTNGSASERMTIGTSGTVTINTPASGTALQVANGVANSFAAVFTGNNTSGQSYGALIQGGTTSADEALRVTTQNGSTQLMNIFGDGGVRVGSATGGSQGAGTLNAQGLFVNGVAVGTGGGVLVAKSGATDRSSTTTLASDSDLQFTAVSGGTYAIDFCLNFAGVSTGTQGFKFAINMTSAGSNNGMWSGGSRVNGSTSAAHSGIAMALGNGDTTGQISFATISTGNGTNQVCGQGTIVQSGGVTYAVQWAQNSSSANATRLGQGSYIRYTRTN